VKRKGRKAKSNRKDKCGHMPVMWVPDQPRHEKVSETLSHKNKLGARCGGSHLNPNYLGSRGLEDHGSRSAGAKS
jgi:hypothetical protein